MASNCLIGSPVLMDEWKVVPEGRRLLAALAESYRVVVALDTSDVERFEVWARLEAIKGHQEVIPNIVPGALRGEDERIAQVKHLRGRGEDVVLFVDTDPRRVAEAMNEGIPSLLFCHPKFQRPEFRPDYDGSLRPWTDLVAEIEKQHYLSTQISG